MADPENEAKPTPPGIYDRPVANDTSLAELVAAAVAVFWLGGTTIYLFSRESGESLNALLTLVVIVLPLAMIWVAAMSARSARMMREESRRLQAGIDAIRQAYIAQAQGREVSVEDSVVRKLEEIAETTRNTETALATFHSTRSETPMAAPVETFSDGEEQPALELGTRIEDLPPALPSNEIIRALNFPETAEDEDGFAALRRAMRDRGTAQLITAAQDVLTLLSQDGIYMDDLRPDQARPELWRQFAEGARGRTIAALGGIHDRSSLALSAGRMKQDPIFRDAAHHFLRRFDKHFSEFAETATDEEIIQLTNTRTARAFMLLGRAAGTFD